MAENEAILIQPRLVIHQICPINEQKFCETTSSLKHNSDWRTDTRKDAANGVKERGTANKKRNPGPLRF